MMNSTSNWSEWDATIIGQRIEYLMRRGGVKCVEFTVDYPDSLIVDNKYFYPQSWFLNDYIFYERIAPKFVA